MCACATHNNRVQHWTGGHQPTHKTVEPDATAHRCKQHAFMRCSGGVETLYQHHAVKILIIVTDLVISIASSPASSLLLIVVISISIAGWSHSMGAISTKPPQSASQQSQSMSQQTHSAALKHAALHCSLQHAGTPSHAGLVKSRRRSSSTHTAFSVTQMSHLLVSACSRSTGATYQGSIAQQ